MSLSTKARKRVAFIGAITLAAGLVAVGIPALAADDTGSTVVAQVGADGSVTSIEALGGAAKPASNALPIAGADTTRGNSVLSALNSGAGEPAGLTVRVSRSRHPWDPTPTSHKGIENPPHRPRTMHALCNNMDPADAHVKRLLDHGLFCRSRCDSCVRIDRARGERCSRSFTD